MKIVHISIYPPKDKKHIKAGGVSSYTKNLVTNIPYREDDKIFVLCEKINNSYERYIEGGITVIRCFDKNPRYIFQLSKEIKKINPDVIHVQQELGLYGGVLTAYLLQWFLLSLRKYKTVITLHGVVSLKSIDRNFVKQNNSHLPTFLVKPAFYVIYKPLCVFAKKVIVHENVFKEILINEYGVKENKIEVIYHGIEDLAAISREDACRKLNLDASKDLVLFMGYLTGYKGIDLLIEGFSEYLKINPNAFLIIGAGKHPKLFADGAYLKEYSRLENKAKELIPEGRYRWVGFIEESDLVNYYSAADVSVYPYTIQMSSSGPMSIAIGFGKPFLASDAFSGFIENKGILFERSPEKLSECLGKFFKNKGDNLDYVKKLKDERIISSVAYKTYQEYI
jgi:glycosyltransferase involved in cell wall biosynthesis